ncbi:hypothetical protein [Fusibacter ferrireducens]|uniref:Phage abortive infection protein n=1 Tax=Fusibacter ferrireducens TaxID=2785058 RepID=A0ABS0A057_9FIRM|nr:hypothetical protein [Fusibacter ferrireducens]MBF4696085.1 hypothetical protein [Fusibacter ferrireducens]
METFKKKHKYVKLLTSILIVVVLFIINQSEATIWKATPNFLNWIFVKNKDYNILLNLSIGYVISYLFYIMVNYFPELQNSIEKEQENVYLRIARHREVQLLLYDLSSVWGDIFLYSKQNGIINDDISLEQHFNFETLCKILPHINLLAPAFEIEGYERKILWVEKLEVDIERFTKDANVFLTRYKDMPPSNLYYKIFYLCNNSFLVGQLPILLRPAIYLYSENTNLGHAIRTENLKDDINKTFSYIIELDKWFFREINEINKYANDEDKITSMYSFVKN